MAETLSIIENIDVSEGSADVVIDAVANLTEDPDMISPEAASTALNVVDAVGDTELSAESASSAVSAVSSILASGDNTKASDKGMSKEQEKEMSEKIMNVANKILDAIPTDSGPVKLDTPLIKASVEAIDPDEDVASAAPDGSGLQMSNDMLKGLGGGSGDLSVKVVSFKKNTYAHNPKVENQAKGGVASINVNAGDQPIQVKDTELMVTMAVSSAADENTICFFWAGEGPSSEGCKRHSLEDGQLTCVCTHLTDFMGMTSFGTDVLDTFKDGN